VVPSGDAAAAPQAGATPGAVSSPEAADVDIEANDAGPEAADGE
jgi:hypothetical protein